MSVAARVDTDTQLARLLQIGMVLEEVVEARAHEHYRRLPEGEREDAIEALLEHASEESAAHRERLESLVEELDADPVAFESIRSLVGEQYDADTDFDGVLYDQLHGEETAYKFYDDLIAAIEESEASFGVDREHLLGVLRDIRAEEEEGVQDVTELMSAHDADADDTGGGR